MRADSSWRCRFRRLPEVRSEGIAGRQGGSPGDLFVVIDVIPDPILKRNDANMLSACKVSHVNAILGTMIKVPMVDGMVNLKVPAGTQPNATLMMAKEGVPYLNKSNEREGTSCASRSRSQRQNLWPAVENLYRDADSLRFLTTSHFIFSRRSIQRKPCNITPRTGILHSRS